jgi:hypothetical protein
MRWLILLISYFLVSACSGPEEDYMAVYQVVPDAHPFYLGNHYYIATDTNAKPYLIKINNQGEAVQVDKLF